MAEMILYRVCSKGTRAVYQGESLGLFPTDVFVGFISRRLARKMVQKKEGVEVPPFSDNMIKMAENRLVDGDYILYLSAVFFCPGMRMMIRIYPNWEGGLRFYYFK